MPPRKRELKEGTCIKAIQVKCETKRDRSVHVNADEIHIVIDQDNYGMAQSIGNGTRKTNRDRLYEVRKIATAHPFTITIPPVQLQLEDAPNNGSRAIHVKHGSLHATVFKPMTATGHDRVYREINLAEVIFGIDPSTGNHWVTPIALKHIQVVRERVIEAGGLFVADFDTSVGGWAMFRTLYICPAPFHKLYKHSFQIRALWYDVCGRCDVERPLRLAGGKLFKRGFEPTATELADPSIFREIDDVLGIS